jgi:hypothetical protein
MASVRIENGSATGYLLAGQNNLLVRVNSGRGVVEFADDANGLNGVCISDIRNQPAIFIAGVGVIVSPLEGKWYRLVALQSKITGDISEVL